MWKRRSRNRGESELCIKSRQLNPEIYYFDFDDMAAGRAAIRQCGFDKNSTKSLFLAGRIHREQSKVTPVAPNLNIHSSCKMANVCSVNH